MAKIYTKMGDGGTTDIPDQGRVEKSSAIINVTGTIDELESHLGYAESIADDPQLSKILRKLQGQLHSLLAQIIRNDGEGPKITGKHVRRIEEEIENHSKNLPELKRFIYTSGDPVACQLHIARTVARRAERRIVEAAEEKEITPEIKKYMNRLSDLLFTLARYVNHGKGIEEEPVKYE